jgi:hypothetical protein
VIDELMGHTGGHRGGREGSAIGLRYRHTTPEMEARVVAAIERRLATSLAVATQVDSSQRTSSTRIASNVPLASRVVERRTHRG